MIVVLLSCLKSYASNRNDNVPPTGSEIRADTAIVVDINLIKLANAKMIERNYLIVIANQQDSIINMKDKYINEQQKIIADFKKRVIDANKLNENIKKDLDKQKRKNKIIGYTAGTAILGVVIGIITK